MKSKIEPWARENEKKRLEELTRNMKLEEKTIEFVKSANFCLSEFSDTGLCLTKARVIKGILDGDEYYGCVECNGYKPECIDYFPISEVKGGNG